MYRPSAPEDEHASRHGTGQAREPAALATTELLFFQEQFSSALNHSPLSLLIAGRAVGGSLAQSPQVTEHAEITLRLPCGLRER